MRPKCESRVDDCREPSVNGCFVDGPMSSHSDSFRGNKARQLHSLPVAH